MTSNTENLKSEIIAFDKAYREGNALISDHEYDQKIQTLKTLIGESDDFFKSSIKSEIGSESRRDSVPIVMASTAKVKTIKEIHDWFRLKKIPFDTKLIILPKYDGLSICKSEIDGKAWTRGSKDPSKGLRSDEHLKAFNDIKINNIKYSYGEAIISRSNFDLFLKEDYENARNCASGLFRRDTISSELEYVDLIKYGIDGEDFKTKEEIIVFLNQSQKIKVPYCITYLNDLSEEKLKTLYLEYSKEYELDGLIIEIDSIELQKQLGRNRDSDPNYLVAYKGSFETIVETKVIGIQWQISKDSNLIPVVLLEPIFVDGVTISRCTMNNAKYLMNMGIGVGSKVQLLRSGGVIPLIIGILDEKQPLLLPEIECYWDGVHLKTKEITSEQEIKQLSSFFTIIGVENVSEKTFELLYNSGFKTIKDILNMRIEDFNLLERFGERKSDIVYNEIQSKLKDIPLNKLMHASNCFKQLGSKKLLLLEHFEIKPSIDEILTIEGFSDILAQNFIDGYDKFYQFIKDLENHITFKRKIPTEKPITELTDKIFVFSGFRSKELEDQIIFKGGVVSSTISKKTNYLVLKELSSSSSKAEKAREMGVIILGEIELIKLLS